MNLRRSAPPAVRFVPKPTFWSSHTPLLGIKSPPDIYMGKLSMCCIACTKEEQDVLKGSVWETGDLRVSAPQQGKPLVSCVWCFTPGDKLRRTWQLLVLSRGQNSLLLPRPSSDRVLQHLGGERGGCSASLLPATAAVDRSCCTRVSRIRASTHSFSKSSSSRISIWRVAVTDGHEGPSALTASTTTKKKLLWQGAEPFPPLCCPQRSHSTGSTKGGIRFCCPSLLPQMVHLLSQTSHSCYRYSFPTHLVCGNSCCSACPARATKELIQK